MKEVTLEQMIKKGAAHNIDAGVIMVAFLREKSCLNASDEQRAELRTFEEGKRYKISKEKVNADHATEDNRTWADKVDGKEVDVVGNLAAFVDEFIVVPDWCEEIEAQEKPEPKFSAKEVRTDKIYEDENFVIFKKEK